MKSQMKNETGKRLMQKNPVDHNRNADWMTLEKKLECVTQQDNITMEAISIHFWKMPNQKVPGPDGLHGF